MKPRAHHIDWRYRSLLQKAVRRGADNLVITACGLLESLGPKEANWLRKRTPVITFEECWTLGSDLIFNKSLHSKVAALIKTARAVKNRDAAGLGALACGLAEGDRSVLDGSAEDRDIRIVANAVLRPDDFWKWIRAQPVNGPRKALIKNAVRFKNIGQPGEKSRSMAAAYLAATRSYPDPLPSAHQTRTFPYWIVFDQHTRQGTRAIRDIARDLHMTVQQLAWTHYYFEASAANEVLPSRWWDRMCRWRFQKIGIPLQEAHLLWEPAQPQLMEALIEDSHLLHKEVYRWKMVNRERVDSLKKKVELYIANFGTIRKAQQQLF